MSGAGLPATSERSASRDMGAIHGREPSQTRGRRRGNSRRLVAHQVRLEQRAFWRNPEYAALTFAMPLVILLVLGATIAGDVQPDSRLQETTLFVPGMLAFGLIVAAYANLASRIAVL